MNWVQPGMRKRVFHLIPSLCRKKRESSELLLIWEGKNGNPAAIFIRFWVEKVIGRYAVTKHELHRPLCSIDSADFCASVQNWF